MLSRGFTINVSVLPLHPLRHRVGTALLDAAALQTPAQPRAQLRAQSPALSEAEGSRTPPRPPSRPSQAARAHGWEAAGRFSTAATTPRGRDLSVLPVFTPIPSYSHGTGKTSAHAQGERTGGSRLKCLLHPRSRRLSRAQTCGSLRLVACTRPRLAWRSYSSRLVSRGEGVQGRHGQGSAALQPSLRSEGDELS